VVLVFVAVAACVVAAVFGGCTSGSTIGPSGASGSSVSVSVPGSASPPVSGPGTTGITEPPITFAKDPAADAVVAGLQGRLPMSPDEAACVASRLSADAALLDRVKAGVSPGSADFNAVTDLMQRCRQLVTFGGQFVKNMLGQYPDLTAAQQRCLQDGFGSLSPDDLNKLESAGSNPQGSAVSDGTRIMDGLLKGCGVPS
jgi:hypothetical protein